MVRNLDERDIYYLGEYGDGASNREMLQENYNTIFEKNIEKSKTSMIREQYNASFPDGARSIIHIVGYGWIVGRELAVFSNKMSIFVICRSRHIV
jgi:hypothetical protein